MVISETPEITDILLPFVHLKPIWFLITNLVLLEKPFGFRVKTNLVSGKTNLVLNVFWKLPIFAIHIGIIVIHYSIIYRNM